MKIFISYRRKSSSFTLLLANKLSERVQADIFVDFASIDQADFENSILGHLRKSDVFLLMVTEHTFAERIHRDDDWVRQEIRIALEANIPIILVCENGLFPPGDIPADIREVSRKQGIEFYPAYFDPAVERLVDFLGKVAGIQRKTIINQSAPLPVPVEKLEELPEQAAKIDSKNALQTLTDAITAYEENDFGRALFLFEALQRIQYKSKLADIDSLVKDIKSQHDRDERKRIAALDYAEVLVFNTPKTLNYALDAFKKWAEEHAEFVEELDSANLRAKSPGLIVSITGARPSKVKSLLPEPFEWCFIPAGEIRLGQGYDDGAHGVGQTFELPAFEIAKYPVTNAQFAKFMEAGGYQTKQWWTEEGWEEKQKEKWAEPRYWQYDNLNDDEQPIIGISWYEAIAFCLWLSEASSEKIMLPTEQQWQRAAQGNDERIYPWGNQWDANRCNNNIENKGIGKTSYVTFYEGKGDSPFGVVDMAGNAWEWCLTDYNTGSQNSSAKAIRCDRGGAWNSSYPGAYQTVFRGRGSANVSQNNWGFRIARSID